MEDVFKVLGREAGGTQPGMNESNRINVGSEVLYSRKVPSEEYEGLVTPKVQKLAALSRQCDMEV